MLHPGKQGCPVPPLCKGRPGGVESSVHGAGVAMIAASSTSQLFPLRKKFPSLQRRGRKDTGFSLEITPPLRGSRRSQAARRRLRRWGAQGHPRRWPRHPHLHPLPSRERKRKEEQADTQVRPYKNPRPWLPPVMPDPIGHPVSLVSRTKKDSRHWIPD